MRFWYPHLIKPVYKRMLSQFTFPGNGSVKICFGFVSWCWQWECPFEYWNERMLILTQHIPIHSHHLLTPLSRVLLENVTGLQLVKKYPTFYATRSFITAFTSARHLSPSHSNYSTFLNTCKLTSSPKYLFISLCLIMIGKNFFFTCI